MNAPLMQRSCRVHKLDGAGNTFAGIDLRTHGPLGDDRGAALARQLCANDGPFGPLDGLIALEPASNAAFAMHYRNADGSLASMCGNGARCAVWMARAAGEGVPTAFKTAAGIHMGVIVGENRVRVEFPGVLSPPRTIVLSSGDAVEFIDTGVPHAVLWRERIEKVQVLKTAPPIRRAIEFGTAGANVNFACRRGPQRVAVRTYERGVEGETLACGTGAVAVAIAHAAREGLRGALSIEVVPRSGEALTVGFTIDAEGISAVSLTGPARIAATAEVRIDL